MEVFNNVLAIIVVGLTITTYRKDTLLTPHISLRIPYFSLYLITVVAGSLFYNLFSKTYDTYLFLDKFYIAVSIIAVHMILLTMDRHKAWVLIPLVSIIVFALAPYGTSWTDYIQHLRTAQAVSFALLLPVLRHPLIRGFFAYGVLMLLSASIKPYLSEIHKSYVQRHFDPWIFTIMCIVWIWSVGNEHARKWKETRAH